MGTLSAQFELFNTAHFSASEWNGEERVRVRNRPVGGNPVSAMKHKNSGNEARKWLKTKDITFLMLQIQRILRANLHDFDAKRSKNSTHFAKRTEASHSPLITRHCREFGLICESTS